jgi:hypothetical protein
VCVTKREPRRTNRSWAGVFKVWVGLSRRPLLVRTSGARFNVVASDVYFGADRRKRRYQLPEKGVINPDQVLSALKRYLEESGDTEQAVGSKTGVNHHTLHRWLSDNQTPKKGEESWPLPRSFSGAPDTCKSVKVFLGEHSSYTPQWPLEL